MSSWDWAFKVGRPLLEAVSKPVAFGSGIFAVAGFFFKFKGLVAKAGFPELVTQLVPGNEWIFLVLFTSVVGIAAVRVSERCTSAEAERDSFKARQKIFDCLHSVIHHTRDELLRSENRPELQKVKNSKKRQKIAHRIVGDQLGKLEYAMDLVSGRSCTVCLKVLKRDTLNGDHLVSALYGPRTDASRRHASTPLPIGSGLASQVISTKAICFTNDVLADNYFHPLADRERFAKRYRTIVGCPVINDGVVIAMLCVDWREPNVYVKEDMHEPLACFTDVISLAFYLCGSEANFSSKPAPPK